MITPISTIAPVDLLAQGDGAARHVKLLKASQEFESIMLEVMLKPLSKGAAIGGEEDDTASQGPLQSFGVQAMASSLAKSGALGFAERITKAVEKHDPKIRKDATDSQVAPLVADNARGGSSI